jgi:hypothetical protein
LGYLVNSAMWGRSHDNLVLRKILNTTIAAGRRGATGVISMG